MAVRTRMRSSEPVEGPPPEHGRFAGTAGDLLVGGVVSILSLVFAAAVLRVWRGELGVPFSYLGETQYYLMLAKAMEDHGGHLENPSLGAPFGLELHDYAVGTERLNLDLLRALTFVFGSPAAGVNVFYLLGFALAAAAAFLAFRLLGVRRAPAGVCSVLFSLAPYHFARGEGHLFLSMYYAVPLGAYLVLATLSGRPLFARRAGRTGARAYLSSRTLTTLALCAVVASTGIYYAVFTLMLLAAAIVLALVARVGRAAVVGGIASAVLITGIVLVHLAPSVAYRSENGPNLATRRPTAESELLALKFTDLVLPAEDGGLGPLSRLKAQYLSTTPIRSEGGQTLGLVAAAGFLWLLAVALLGLVGRNRAGPPLLRHASAAALVAFLIATVGGISVLVAQVLTAQIRGWNRMSIVIAFFAFLAVALALERLAGRRVLYAAGLAGVALVGLYAQTVGSPVPPYELAGSWKQDRAFVREIESRLPERAAVFVLPYVAFPETGQIVDLNDNDLLRGYVHSSDLRWSFGAMKGRPADWQEELSVLPTPTVLAGAAAAGFSGVYIDRFGYGDRAAGLEAEIATLLGAQPLISASGRHSFFALPKRRLEERGAQAVAALREAVLRPLELVPTGFLPLLRSGPFTIAWAHSPAAELRIVNPSALPRKVQFEAIVDRIGGGPAEVSVVYPGEAPLTVQSPAPLAKELVLQPGENILRFSTTAPPVEASNANELRRHYFRLGDLVVTDSGLKPFVEAPR